MTPEWIANILQLVALVGSVFAAVGGAMLWFVRSQLVTKEELRRHTEAHERAHDELDARLAEGEVRFAALHADLQRLPDQKDLVALTGRVAAVEGVVQAQTAAVEGQTELLARLDRQLDMLIGFHLREAKS